MSNTPEKNNVYIEISTMSDLVANLRNSLETVPGDTSQPSLDEIIKNTDEKRFDVCGERKNKSNPERFWHPTIDLSG